MFTGLCTILLLLLNSRETLWAVAVMPYSTRLIVSRKHTVYCKSLQRVRAFDDNESHKSD